MIDGPYLRNNCVQKPIFVEIIVMKAHQQYFKDLTEEQLSQFKKLESLYIDWNSKINVISRKDIDELYLRQEKFYL